MHPGAELFGSDRMLLESVRGLLRHGSRVVVALPAAGPLAARLREAGAEVVITRMFVLRKRLLRPRGWLQLIRDLVAGTGATVRLLRRLRPNAVYVSTIIAPLWPIFARLRGVPVVSHVHEAESGGVRMVNAMLYAPHLASRQVLVNSRFSRDTIRRALPAVASKSHVLLNGVDSPADPEPARDQLSGAMRILYVGRFSPRKGPDLVIRAADELQRSGCPVTVTLLGSVFTGYEWFEQELRDLAAVSQVQVEFLGFRPEVWSTLAACDVLIVPSRVAEPFGNTAVEGVLALRPVVASTAGGLPEAVAGYPTTALVESDSPQQIALEIRRMRHNWAKIVPRLYSARAEALRRHAPEVYQRAVAEAVMAVVRHGE
ncbi:glycosyltransferase family 4 protein [Ruania albidiflava]|uniref:glycosyltransferase family 4 protein n=1 Tax=Ruania albidiflava TaxID=366586 RepID=UPI001FE232FA|nr:glycosyltransferase family 4 protein [Ruania albidiflava]